MGRYKQYRLDNNKIKVLSTLVVVLIIAAIGTYLLVSSHAATPFTSTTADNGTLANGAASCPDTAASNGGSVVFQQSVPMDGTVSLGLSCPGTPFAASSFWNTPLPATTPINPDNAAYQSDIAYDVCNTNLPSPAVTPPCTAPNYGALITSTYSAPLYVVPADQPLVSVTRACTYAATIVGTPAVGDSQITVSGIPASDIVVHQPATINDSSRLELDVNGTETTVVISAVATNSDASLTLSLVQALPVAPTGKITIYSANPNTGFDNSVAAGVPIPADAHAAVGTDGEVQIYQPSTNTYWDFWRFQKDVSGNWDACWGGAIDNVSQSDGVFPSDLGATASSLPLIGGVVRIDELRAGHIDHAMGLILANNLKSSVVPANAPAGVTNGVSWPATRSDGISTSDTAIPEGLRLRLPPECTSPPAAPISPCITLSSYDLSPVAMTIAVAAQKYGFVVYDSGPRFTPSIRLGDPTTYTNQPSPNLANPYTTGPGVGGVGDTGLFAGVSPSLVMENFPWDQLQALPFNYGEPSGT
jgi:hypothetical protein